MVATTSWEIIVDLAHEVDHGCISGQPDPQVVERLARSLHAFEEAMASGAFGMRPGCRKVDARGRRGIR